MSDSELDTVRMLGMALQVLGLFSLLAQLGVAIAAFVRLRATPSGLLVGSGYAGIVLLGCCYRGADLLQQARETGDEATWRAMSMAGAGLSCIDSILIVAVGIGLMLLPESFQRLAGGGARAREP